MSLSYAAMRRCAPLAEARRCPAGMPGSGASRRVGAGGVAFHHQPGAPARDMRHHRRAPMELGDRAEIDGEGQNDRLALAQPEIRSLDEDARGAQVHRFAELAAAARNRDVDGSPGTVPRVQATFHYGPRGFWIF